MKWNCINHKKDAQKFQKLPATAAFSATLFPALQLVSFCYFLLESSFHIIKMWCIKREKNRKEMQKQKPENKIVHTTAKEQLCAEDEQYGKENKCSRV